MSHIIGFAVAFGAAIVVRTPLDALGTPWIASFSIGVIASAFACHFAMRAYEGRSYHPDEMLSQTEAAKRQEDT